MEFGQIIRFFGPIAIFSFFLTVLLVLVALKFFPKIGLMDRPWRYGLKRKPIPYYGGLAVVLAFMISLIVFVPISREVLGVLIAALLIAGVGFLDDLFNIRPSVRAVVQVIAVGVLVIAGVGIMSFKIPFLGSFGLDQWVYDFEMIGYAFSISVLGSMFLVFWILAIVNAMNFLDGISGLNSGVTAVASLTIFVLSIHPGVHEDPSSQMGVASLSIILAMVAFAYLFYDFPKPAILMGDTGSTFFGFMLAVLAIYSGGKVATAFLVLGIPVLDMIWVILRRTFIERKKFWQGDLMHMHHRFLYYGLSEGQVVALYLFVSSVFGAFAVLFVDTQQKFFIIIGLVVLMVLLAGMVVFGRKTK